MYRLLQVIVILWTALGLALGLEIHGEIIRGLPCIKRLNQLFCPTAGNTYPLERIERFIDDNKALMRRMYGEFQAPSDYVGTAKRSVKKRSIPDELIEDEPFSSYFDSGDHLNREKRQSFRSNQSNSGRMDACESSVEIVTPYWAANSAGKVRAIVNTQHFEQAVHQEVCSRKVATKRCSGECGCEQKYKWHRLLAYDPDNDCKGIFMDWFLFPSCCVCRCQPFGNK